MENDENNIENNIDNSQPELSEKEIEKQQTHEASKKTAHIAGKVAATYFGGEKGAKIYDIASKTKAGQKVEELAGKSIEKSTLGIGNKAMRKADEKGVLDVATQIVDSVSSDPTKINQINNKMNPNLSKGSKAKSTNQNISNINNKHDLVTRPKVEPKTEENINSEKVDNAEKLEEKINNENTDNKKEKNANFLVNFLKNNPLGMMLLVTAAMIGLVIFYYIYTAVTDMDLVGTGISEYSEAEYKDGYCNKIILVKEHPSFSGTAVSSIDDVDLAETFTLNNRSEQRWSTTEYNLEEYVKGVLQAEALNVKDEKTFEVASIAARTYALQIANDKCYTWDNTNTRTTYRNPQNFTTDTPDSSISSAVNTTSGVVITLNDELVNMDNSNYYDYFCHEGKDVDDENHAYLKMLQENEEERLLIPIDWAKENVNGNPNIMAANGDYQRSGKYDSQCQKEGMSLYGAKYLLNKKMHAYTTFRILKYYYGYDIEFKKVSSASFAAYGCSEINMKNTTLTKEQFIQLVNEYASTSSKNGARVLAGIAGQIYDMSLQNNVNPELVFIRAHAEGYSPGSGNNYWGLGCFNGSDRCYSYSSLSEGVLAFIQNVSQYDTISSMMSRYAYIGSTWDPADKNNPSGGGCYYFESIKPYLSAQRAATINAACNGTVAIQTNEEDQQAYSMYQVKIMQGYREKIFKISSTDCSNAAGDVTGPGACTLWAQGDPMWATDKLGASTKTMSSSGCLVTAITMAMSCSGTPLTENINPKVFLNKLNAANAFQGPNYIWNVGDNVIRSIAPGFVNRVDVQTNKIHATVVAKLNQYNSSKSMIVFQINNSAHSQHWVLFKSLSGNTITVYDPAGGRINTYPTTDVVRLRIYTFL